MKIGPFKLKQVTLLCAIFSLVGVFAHAQQNRFVVVDQDAIGPGGTDMNSILVFLQSPNVTVLGITVVTGDGWRNEEVAHTLRLLELVGRTDIPVVPGMNTPMIRTPLADAYGPGGIEEMIRLRDSQVPMGKMGDAWDVAYAALFLASDESKYITGASLVVDGGLTCKCS